MTGAASRQEHTPLVSVVIVTHNRKDDLRDAITSACAQTYERIEVIVVDNHSTDGTIELLRDEFQPVTTMTLARNTGPCVGRNVGAAKATGEILFFLDDDATLRSDAIGRIVRRLEPEPQLGVVVSRVLQTTSPARTSQHSRRSSWPIDEEFYLGDLVIEGATAIRREAFVRAGGWRENLVRCSEGRDLSYRVLDAGYSIIYYPEAVAYHKLSPLGDTPRELIAQRKAYLTVRNELWISWTYLPVDRAVLETAIKLVYYPLSSLRQRTLRACLDGIVGAFKTLPVVVRAQRQPIRLDTLAKYDRMLQPSVVDDPVQLEGIAPLSALQFMRTKWGLLRDS